MKFFKSPIFFISFFIIAAIILIVIAVKWQAVEKKIPDVLGVGFTLPWEEKQTYDLLVKKTQTGIGDGAYQAGDIVAIQPAGYQWSAGEINSFNIIKLELTPRQAEELLKSKESKEKDENGMAKQEARRKYFIELPAPALNNEGKLEIDVGEIRKR